MKALFLSTGLFFMLLTSAQQPTDSLTVEKFTYNRKEALKIYFIRQADYDTSNRYSTVIIFHGKA